MTVTGSSAVTEILPFIFDATGSLNVTATLSVDVTENPLMTRSLNVSGSLNVTRSPT